MKEQLHLIVSAHNLNKWKAAKLLEPFCLGDTKYANYEVTFTLDFSNMNLCYQAVIFDTYIKIYAL